MRILPSIAALLFLAPFALAAGEASRGAVSPRPDVRDVAGAYVEARTASVFAGACHFGSEFTTAGREALLAWQFERGSIDGVSLAGLTVVATVAGDANLDEPDAARASVIYLSKDLDAAHRAAVLAWLRAEHGSTLGEIRAVRSVEVAFAFADDAYRVRAGEGISLEGSLLPNRDCCRMEYAVWYRPFDRAVAQPIVGEAVEFRCSEPALERTFVVRRANCVFAGRFGAGAPLGS